MFCPGNLFKGFHPNQVSGLVLWLDAADPSGNGVLPSNGSSLATWVDKSIKGNNATQSTGANQPTFNTGQINNLPSITFTPSKYMGMTGTGFPTGSNARTFIAVVNNTSVSTNGYIFTYGTNAVNEYWAPLIDGSQMFIDTNAKGAHGSTTLVNSTNYIWEMNYTAASNLSTTSMILNGVTQTVTASTDAVPNTVGTTSYISQFQGLTGFGWTGQFSEILFYNSSLSTTNQLQIRRYLAAKWGISV